VLLAFALGVGFDDPPKKSSSNKLPDEPDDAGLDVAVLLAGAEKNESKSSDDDDEKAFEEDDEDAGFDALGGGANLEPGGGASLPSELNSDGAPDLVVEAVGFLTLTLT